MVKVVRSAYTIHRARHGQQADSARALKARVKSMLHCCTRYCVVLHGTLLIVLYCIVSCLVLHYIVLYCYYYCCSSLLAARENRQKCVWSPQMETGTTNIDTFLYRAGEKRSNVRHHIGPCLIWLDVGMEQRSIKHVLAALWYYSYSCDTRIVSRSGNRAIYRSIHIYTYRCNKILRKYDIYLWIVFAFKQN